MPSLPIPIFVSLVLGFAFLRVWMDQKRLTALGWLLAICALQALIIALAQHYKVSAALWLQPVTASIIPPIAWLAYQNSAVRNLIPSDLIHGLVPGLTSAAILVAPRFLDVLLPGAFFSYGAAIILSTGRGADAQPRTSLAHDSMPVRVWVVIGSALVASAFADVLIFLVQVTEYQDWQPWIITVFSVGNLLLIGLFSLSPYLQSNSEDQVDVPPPPAEPDAELWTRLTKHMVDAQPYLDPDLTITRLARQLRVPAKSLSTTINRATGANVSRFVNDARIKEAQKVLLQGRSVTEAMLTSGFNTKSNFNREFLRVAGSSPTKWAEKISLNEKAHRSEVSECAGERDQSSHEDSRSLKGSG